MMEIVLCTIDKSNFFSISRLFSMIFFVWNQTSVECFVAVKRNVPKPMHCLMLAGTHQSSCPVNTLQSPSGSRQYAVRYKFYSFVGVSEAPTRDLDGDNCIQCCPFQQIKADCKQSRVKITAAKQE